MADIKLTSKFVDVGLYSSSGGNFRGYAQGIFGDISETADGTTDATTSNLAATTVTIWGVYWQDYITDNFWLWMEGNRPNGGWTAVEVGGTRFTRSAASGYSYNSSTNRTSWYWATGTNPFGTTAGANVTVDIVIDLATTHGGTVSPTALTSTETTTAVYTLSSALSTKYRIIKKTGSTPVVSDGGTINSRTGNGNINIPTAGLPDPGVTATYQVQIGGPYSQTSDNEAWIDTTGTNNNFSITRYASIGISSGAISLNDLQTLFGGTSPASLSEYYRGGGLVPDIPENSAIPTSGTISLDDFYDSEG